MMFTKVRLLLGMLVSAGLVGATVPVVALADVAGEDFVAEALISVVDESLLAEDSDAVSPDGGAACEGPGVSVDGSPADGIDAPGIVEIPSFEPGVSIEEDGALPPIESVGPATKDGSLETVIDSLTSTEGSVEVIAGSSAMGEGAAGETSDPMLMAVDTTGWRYADANGSVTILGYDGLLVDLVIPSKIDGLPVTSINGSAFFGCTSLKSVSIPEGVTSIGSAAFYGCTSLTSVTIPASVTSLGDSAFYGCTSLPALAIPSGVTSIEDWTFYGCSALKSVDIPSGVTSIGSYAFSRCSQLNGMSIPSGVTSIGQWAFFGCSSLKTITVPRGVTVIPDFAFCGCSSLGSLAILGNVNAIGESAFSRCSSLTSLSIPGTVKSIAVSAFSACASLTSFVLPGGVTSIPDYAFSGCTSLRTITIPGGVTSIGTSAFSGCESLASLDIPIGLKSIGDLTFSCCYSLPSVVIPAGVTSIGDRPFAWSDSTIIYTYAGSYADVFFGDRDVNLGDVPGGESLDGFINGFYQVILGRDGDEGGMAYWRQTLQSGISATVMVQSFLTGEEYSSRGVSDSEFVRAAYLTVQGREPDPEGLAYWTAQVGTKGRTQVVAEICASDEFRARCASLGAKATPYDGMDERESFVAGFYVTIIGREPDSEGLAYWMGEVDRGVTATEVVQRFCSGPEFEARDYSDQEFVKILYRLCMGREADAEGLSYWVGELRGQTRAQVIDRFCGGPEFGALCEQKGLAR